MIFCRFRWPRGLRRRSDGRSLAGILGSNSAEGMVFRPLRVLRVVMRRSLRRADHSSRGFLPSVVCLSVISKPQQLGSLEPPVFGVMKKYYFSVSFTFRYVKTTHEVKAKVLLAFKEAHIHIL
jgi:hypothetical protein